MAAKRGRTITSLGQAFPTISGAEPISFIVGRAVLSEEMVYEAGVSADILYLATLREELVYEVTLSEEEE